MFLLYNVVQRLSVFFFQVTIRRYFLNRVLKSRSQKGLSIKYVRSIFLKTKELEMLVFRKILRTYLMDDPEPNWHFYC